MAVSAKMQKQIDLRASKLNKNEFLKPSGGIQNFIVRFGSSAAQAGKDKDPLIRANFSLDEIEYSQALFENLALAYGMRVGSAPKIDGERAEYIKLKETAEMDVKIMREVISHIIDVTQDASVKKRYDKIVDGSSAVDTFTDVIALASAIEEYPEEARQIKPLGVEMTPEYLLKVKDNALRGLSLRVSLGASGNIPSDTVDRQNRILTLCVKAEAEIRKFAHAAFLDNYEHYLRYYAIKGKKSDSPSDEEVENEEQPENALEATDENPQPEDKNQKAEEEGMTEE